MSLLLTMGTLAKPSADLACADAIRIDGAAKDERELRRLLRRSSLGKPVEGCVEHRVKLTRSGAEGWQVEMTRSSSSRRYERQVKKLSYAATWVEAWLQSGFAPTPDEAAAPRSVPPPSREPQSAIAPPAPESIPVFVGLEPVATITSHGHGLLGAAIIAGLPARRTPWFGVDMGGAAQLGMSGSDYRRSYWAGPLLGASFALSDRLRLRPNASMGVMGVAADTGTQSGHSAGAYVGIGGALEYDLSQNLSLSAGLDARLFLEHLFGSAQTTATKTEVEDDGEVETDTMTAAAPRLGFLLCSARVGIIWRFGGPS